MLQDRELLEIQAQGNREGIERIVGVHRESSERAEKATEILANVSFLTASF